MNTTKPLGDRLTLSIFSTKDGAAGQLLIMDPQLGDVMLATFEGSTIEAVEGAAGVYLRDLGRQCDGKPTVSSLIVRNDPMTLHQSAEREVYGREPQRYDWQNPEHWTVLKVMVELEHEQGPRRMRIVQSHSFLTEGLGENIDHASYTFNREEDPVSKQWRNAPIGLTQGPQSAPRERNANETVGWYGRDRRERRGRSRGKPAT